MGFFSAISTGIGTIASLGSSICSGLAIASSKLGGVIGCALGGFSKMIAMIPDPETIELTIKIISAVVKGIGEALGLINNKEEVEELGAKALQAEEKPEDFDSIEEYIEYLKNEVELDQEKFNNISKEEKLTCSAIGSTILAKGISEKKGIDVSIEFLADIGKLNLKAKEVEAYIDNFKSNSLDLNLGDYLKGNLTASENLNIRPIVLDTIKELNPTFSDKESKEKLGEMKMLLNEK